jgi:hypothetical protein
MKSVALLGAKRQRKQENLKSFLVQSASIRIRKCTCHSEDRQSVNNATLTAATVKPNKQREERAMKLC